MYSPLNWPLQKLTVTDSQGVPRQKLHLREQLFQGKAGIKRYFTDSKHFIDSMFVWKQKFLYFKKHFDNYHQLTILF